MQMYGKVQCPLECIAWSRNVMTPVQIEEWFLGFVSQIPVLETYTIYD